MCLRYSYKLQLVIDFAIASCYLAFISLSMHFSFMQCSLNISAMSRSYSHLQRQVLKLYKDFMIALRPGSSAKLEEAVKPQIRQVVREEFRKNARTLKKTHFVRIETLLRQGQRRLDDLKNGRIADITMVSFRSQNKK